MKLLLTSAGFTNKAIANALLELTGKKFEDLKIVFIPTAANVETDDKGWLIDDLVNCKKLGFKQINIVDISTPEENIWMPVIESADVILFGGGNTFHLMHWIKKTGLDKKLPELLKTKVYVGISAGSMVTTPSLALSQSKKLYYEDLKGKPSDKALGFVDFQIRPHLNSPDFPKVRVEYLEKLAKEIKDPIYALDDQSAIKVDGATITVISEGKWKKFN